MRLIEHDNADVLAVDAVAHVAVADRAGPGRAAELGLFDHALLALQGQVAGIELSDGAMTACSKVPLGVRANSGRPDYVEWQPVS